MDINQIKNHINSLDISSTNNCVVLLMSDNINKVISYLPIDDDHDVSIEMANFILSFLIKFAKTIQNSLQDPEVIERLSNLQIFNSLYQKFQTYSNNYHCFQIAVILCLLLTSQKIPGDMEDILISIQEIVISYEQMSNADLSLALFSLRSVVSVNKFMIYSLDLAIPLTKVLERDEILVVSSSLAIIENLLPIYTHNDLQKHLQAGLWSFFLFLFDMMQLSDNKKFHLPLKLMLKITHNILNRGEQYIQHFINTPIISFITNLLIPASSLEEDESVRFVYKDVLMLIVNIFHCCKVVIGKLFVYRVPFVALELLNLLLVHLNNGNMEYENIMYEFIILFFNLSGLAMTPHPETNLVIEELRSFPSINKAKDIFLALNALQLEWEHRNECLETLSVSIARLLRGKTPDVTYFPVLQRVYQLAQLGDFNLMSRNATIAWEGMVNPELVLIQAQM